MTASVTLVRNALATRLGTVAGTTVKVDRARGDALSDSEVPALVLNVGDQAMSLFDANSTMQHAAMFDIDVYEKASGSTSLADQQNNRVAKIVAALGTDWTLGGRLQDLNVRDVTAPDANAADIGAVTLTIEAVWFTPTWDFETILGQSGLFT